MSIEKKSLISTLKTAKKANAASSGPEASHVVSKRQTKMVSKRQTKMVSKRQTKMVSKRAGDSA